jgi:pimeloyl-ACP methyl ester carboxylesterase
MRINTNDDRTVSFMSFSKSGRAKLRSLWTVFVSVIVLLGSGCNLILEPIEHRFLFRPWGGDAARLASIAASDNGLEEIRLPTSDGVTLHGWLKRPRTARSGERFPLVIVFGGARRETSWLINRAAGPEQWGWLFINYRGFGLSEGDPSERVVVADTRLIYDYAAARPDVDATKIVVLGRSLGTYFTVALASSRALRGAILATPFDSIAAVGEERYPWLPVGLILNGRYDAASMAPKIKVPALFVLAENDDVTPMQNGVALADAWGGPRRIVTLAGARHYGIERREEFWNAVEEFLGEIESKPQDRNGYLLKSDSGANQ